MLRTIGLGADIYKFMAFTRIQHETIVCRLVRFIAIEAFVWNGNSNRYVRSSRKYNRISYTKRRLGIGIKT